MAPALDYTKDVDVVYACELEYLRKRRETLGLSREISLPSAGDGGGDGGSHGIPPRIGDDTVGLALSGGGIRSATFSLGVLQALARLDLLKYVDYLSTVSGGGYIGSCVTSLLAADKEAGVRPATSETQRFPLGFTGADRERPEVQHLRDYSNYIAPQHGPFKLGTWKMITWYLGALLFNLICPLSIAACVLIVGLSIEVFLWDRRWLAIPLLAWIVVALGVILVASLGVLFFHARTKASRDRISGAAALLAALSAVPLFLFVAPTGYDWFVSLTLRAQPIGIEQLEKGLTIADLCAASAEGRCDKVSGTVSQLISALKWSGAWVGRGPSTRAQLRQGFVEARVATEDAAGTDGTGRGARADWRFTGPLDRIFLGLNRTGFVIGAGAGGLASWLSPLLALLAIAIPPALVGYVKGSLRIFGVALIAFLGVTLFIHFLGWAYDTHRDMLLRWLPWCALVSVVSGFLVNVNKVSLLNFYRDRLADCYVIKHQSSGPGAGSPIVTNDSLTLDGILSHHTGPYHLLNGTLNLAGSQDLSLRGRMAAPFFFSKYFCGSSRLGYRSTPTYLGGKLDLATPMAICAAAVSPQSGSLTRPGLAVLMTLLNLRLGHWLPNPAEERKHSYVFWNLYFLKELFSLADENDWFVFVSDGGHFENMGVYPLLERRCKTIVAVDCGADPDRKFEDLAGLIRKARIDFGIQIDINLTKLHGNPTTTHVEEAFAVGTILYPDNKQDPGGEGSFIYIKPALSSNESESEDLLEYARNHPTFPQESTADQFFDEAQFESYRELGYQITKRALANTGPWLRGVWPSIGGTPPVSV